MMEQPCGLGINHHHLHFMDEEEEVQRHWRAWWSPASRKSQGQELNGNRSDPRVHALNHRPCYLFCFRSLQKREIEPAESVIHNECRLSTKTYWILHYVMRINTPLMSLVFFHVSFEIVSVMFPGGDWTHEILMCFDVILFTSEN